MKKMMSIATWLTVLMVMMSCDNMNADDGLTADEELILKIENAAILESVNESDLPTKSKTVLSTDYTESTLEEAQLAADLGYVVSLRKHRGADFGESSQTFFDLEGNELKARSGRRGPKGGKGPRGDRDHHDPFEFVYPISVTMPDASVITGNSEEEMKIAIKAWFDSNQDTDRSERPELIFPIQIVLEDSSVVTVNSREELKELFPPEDRPNHGPNADRPKIFEFVFPVTFDMPDGSTVEASSKEELATGLKAWHEANPDSDERGSVQFPVDIQFMDDSVVTVNSEDEIKAAVKTWIENNPRPNSERK